MGDTPLTIEKEPHYTQDTVSGTTLQAEVKWDGLVNVFVSGETTLSDTQNI